MKISWLLDKFLYAYRLQQFKCSVYVIMNRRFFSVAKKKKRKKESREYKSSNKRFQEKEYSWSYSLLCVRLCCLDQDRRRSGWV